MKSNKKQSEYNAVNDVKTVSNDFKLKSTVLGYESFRTVDYRLYHKLSEETMIPLLDGLLTKLFAGEVDSGNGDVLDNNLFGIAIEAVSDLNDQYYDHIDMLRRLIIRGKSDRNDIYRIKELRQKEIDALQAEYDKICLLLSDLEEV